MRTFLPELVSDVLLRLPVKSLLRFRCLSTSLCDEIDGPDFVNNHLSRSIQSRIRQKLIINNRNGTHFYILDFDGGLKEATVLKYPFKSPRGSPVAIGGSCNGLILFVLGKATKRITFWNPFTRQYKKIPPCPTETLPGYKSTHRLGLGHDPAHDDYKILMISAFYESDFWGQSWVFSLKQNSWRRSQDPPRKLRGKLSSKASFANGALYWHSIGDNPKIVGFDLTNEVYFKIWLFVDSGLLINRLDTQTLYFCYDTMSVFGGKLYTTKVTAESKTLEFYLDVSDNGRKGRWKKAFEMENEEMERALNDEDDEDDSRHRRFRRHRRFLDLPRPLAYSKDGDSILTYKKNEVFWYNPETKSRQRVEILGIPPAQSEWDNLNDNCYSFHVGWESLVSLGNEGVSDAAPEMSRIATLREIAAENLTGMNLARLACLCFLLYFDFWPNLFLLCLCSVLCYCLSRFLMP